MNKRVAIITSGYFPLPPTKGGAVEALVNEIISENERFNSINLTIYSIYDQEAFNESKNIKNTIFSFVSTPSIIKFGDKIIYFLAKNVLRKKKNLSYRYILQRLFFIRKVGDRIADADYDCIVIENHPTLLGIFKRHNNIEKYKNKICYHAHNEMTNDFGNTDILKNVSKFICVSNYISEKIRNHLSLPNNSRQFVVLKNRVDETRFRNISDEEIDIFRSRYGIDKNTLVFTFTGRLNKEKGIRELLLAFEKANINNSKLLIVGSYYFGSGMTSEYEKELYKIAKRLQDKVIFTGNISYDQMPIVYAASNVMVLPSIWNDPAPLTIIESLTVGKTLITTNKGGIPEYANSENSIMLDVDDHFVDNLANAIKELSINKKLRKNLEVAANEDSKNWREEDFYKEFVGIVTNLENE